MTHYIIADNMAAARKAEADYRQRNSYAEVVLAAGRNAYRRLEGIRLFPGDTFVEVADPANSEGDDPDFRYTWDILLRSAIMSKVKIRRRMGKWLAIPTADHPIFKVDPLLDDVRNERVEQLRKWGVQHHEFRTVFPETAQAYYREMEAYYKSVFKEQGPAAGWDAILLEEVYEALAEDDPEKRAKELIQVAAVALAIIEDIQSS